MAKIFGEAIFGEGDTMQLIDAITAVEAAQQGLSAADQAQNAAQAKYDAAVAAKDSADKADADAVKAFNDSLDVLIQAATASKVVRDALGVSKVQ